MRQVFTGLGQNGSALRASPLDHRCQFVGVLRLQCGQKLVSRRYHARVNFPPDYQGVIPKLRNNRSTSLGSRCRLTRARAAVTVKNVTGIDTANANWAVRQSVPNNAQPRANNTSVTMKTPVEAASNASSTPDASA